ncbi:crotonase/enoyl-CoA hydratase family protein [Streptomyces soliscabiei]|uniref:crotonase/enoyl-CoA hydratase family protein n=1 Tax=Streptomyces soliscabiei TaxID=588897 RepID=UPI0029BC10ED|nr:crotonase/enoyl-CoA hydratase family protein [Streptomyces sp. NY05-11A]MDX2676672.1 crotonase/enoyl-CoA hydratase family protein [Streptomyces sp. NY05-11A]
MASEMSPAVLTELSEHVLIVTINRPDALNAVNQAVWDGLGDALDRAQTDPAVRVVVITGAGDRAFCAGADLKAIARHEFRTVPHPRYDAWGFAGVATHPIGKPVIASVNGIAFGGGWEIALACDMVVTADTARFGFPEVKRGLVAGGGGALRLPRRLPPALAMQVLLTGDPIDAQDAARWGLVNAVFPQAQVLTGALDLAGRIAANAPLAVQATKRIAAGIEGDRVPAEDAGWHSNAHELSLVLRSEDAAEGPRSFAEKRTPVWQGR